MKEALQLYAQILKELHTSNSENNPELLLILTDYAPVQFSVMLHATPTPALFPAVMHSNMAKLFGCRGVEIAVPPRFSHLHDVLARKGFNGATWSFVPNQGRLYD